MNDARTRPALAIFCSRRLHLFFLAIRIANSECGGRRDTFCPTPVRWESLCTTSTNIFFSATANSDIGTLAHCIVVHVVYTTTVLGKHSIIFLRFFNAQDSVTCVRCLHYPPSPCLFSLVASLHKKRERKMRAYRTPSTLTSHFLQVQCVVQWSLHDKILAAWILNALLCHLPPSYGKWCRHHLSSVSSASFFRHLPMLPLPCNQKPQVGGQQKKNFIISKVSRLNYVVKKKISS